MHTFHFLEILIAERQDHLSRISFFNHSLGGMDALPMSIVEDEPVPDLFDDESPGAGDAVKKPSEPKIMEEPVEYLGLLVLVITAQHDNLLVHLGPILRRTVVFEKTYGTDSKILLREFSGVEAVDGSVLLEGFPAVSITPLLSASYAVEQLKLPLLAVCNSTEFPARCVVERGQPGAPVRVFGNEHLCVWYADR
jgi:hypothetical protein